MADDETIALVPGAQTHVNISNQHRLLKTAGAVVVSLLATACGMSLACRLAATVLSSEPELVQQQQGGEPGPWCLPASYRAEGVGFLFGDFGKVIFDQPTDGVAPETLFPEQECTGSVAHVRDGDTDYFMMDFRVRDGTGLGFGAVANRDGSGASFVLEYTAGGTVCTTDALPEVEVYGNAFETQSCSDGWFFAAPDDAMSKPAPGGLTYTVRAGASPWKNDLNFSGVVYSVPPPDAPRHRRRRARRTQDLVLLHQRFRAAGDAHATNDAAFLDLTFTGNLLDVDAQHFEALLGACRGGGGGGGA